MSERDYWGRPPYDAVYDEEGFPRDAKRDEHYYAAVALTTYADRLSGKRPLVKIYKDYTEDFAAYFGSNNMSVQQDIRLETFDPMLNNGNVHFVLWYRIAEQRYGIKAIIDVHQTRDLDKFNLALHYTFQNLCVALDRALDQQLDASGGAS